MKCAVVVVQKQTWSFDAFTFDATFDTTRSRKKEGAHTVDDILLPPSLTPSFANR